MAERIGIFGLGLIGTALAERLLAAGHSVAGFDPDPARGAALAEAGGAPVDAPAIWECYLILSAVFDTDQLASIIETAPQQTGRVLVTMSTCDPDQITQLAGTAQTRGITLVEAPISGTSRQVQHGTALLLLAGDPAGLDAFEVVADAISPNRQRVGAIGDGNRTKLAINCILGLNRAAVAEGLVFAGAMGLDPEVFLQTALGSAARSNVMAAKGPAMVARDFAPLGRITQSKKDFSLIQEMAGRGGYPDLPLVARYLDLMQDAEAAGEGDLDNSAVLLAIERLAKG